MIEWAARLIALLGPADSINAAPCAAPLVFDESQSSERRQDGRSRDSVGAGRT